MTHSKKLRHRIFVLAMGAVLAGVSAFHFSFMIADFPGNFWSQLGISESRGTENIRKSFIEGYLYTYGASAAKKIAAGDRVSVVNEAMAYAKSYVATPAFQDAYKQAREQQKPVPPPPARPKEAVQAEQIATLEKSLADTEKSIRASSPELQESLKEVVKMFNDQIADFRNPESDMLKYLVEAENFNHESAMQTYNTNLAAWEKAYPENYQMIIKARLEKFMAITADVDYTAGVHDEYGLKKFNDAAYEKKPGEWKMAYRAGKPVVDAARGFVATWLKELDK